MKEKAETTKTKLDESLFESRVLTEYRTDWPNGKNGCLFYVQETDCICLLDTPYRKGDNPIVETVHQGEIEASRNEECQIAWGFPALLFAIFWTGRCEKFDYRELAIDYLDVPERVLATRKVIIYEEWTKTLQYWKSSKFESEFWSIKRSIGDVLKELARNFEDVNQGSSTIFDSQGEPLAVLLRISENDVLYTFLVWYDEYNCFEVSYDTPFPCLTTLVDCCDEQGNILARGLIATLINNSFCASKNDFIKNSDFEDIDSLQSLIDSLSIDNYYQVALIELNFKSAHSYISSFKQYINRISCYIEEDMEKDPNIPLATIKAENGIYSYILCEEEKAYAEFKNGDLYKAMTEDQHEQLDLIFRRYVEYLETEHHADRTLITGTTATPLTPTQQPVHTTPFENDYVAVIEWLDEEERRGTDWYKLNNNNRTAMCRQLSKLFGWTVDQNSLGKAQKRTN